MCLKVLKLICHLFKGSQVNFSFETFSLNRKIITSNEMVGFPLAVARNGLVMHKGRNNQHVF